MKKIFLILIIVLVGIQFIPVEKTNPPVESELRAPKPVLETFKKSCYDCHSNETKWFWYSDFAPVSWLIVKDVNEGREHLNFSNWGKMSPGDIDKMKREIWEEVESGEMPLGTYTLIHPELKLTNQDLSTIRDWAGAAPKRFNSK